MNKSIASVSRQTIAEWIMIYNFALSIETARACAWINAFLVLTCSVTWTVGIKNAFWTACRWTTDVARKTRTNCLAIHFSTLSIIATRRWLARIVFDNRILLHNSNGRASNIRISFHSAWTSTHRKVIVDSTHCGWSTCTIARVNTFTLNASFISQTIAIQNTFRSAYCIWIAMQARET